MANAAVVPISPSYIIGSGRASGEIQTPIADQPSYAFTGWDLNPVQGSEPVPQQKLYNALVMHNRLLWLSLITQNPIPTGKFATTMLGSAIGAVDQYITLLENRTPNPIGARVLGIFTGVPGKQVKISLTEEKSDAGVVDYLGNTAAAPSFNKRLSDTIILMPRQKLFINTADTLFALAATDLFRVRVIDPAEILASDLWRTVR